MVFISLRSDLIICASRGVAWGGKARVSVNTSGMSWSQFHDGMWFEDTFFGFQNCDSLFIVMTNDFV